MLVVAYRKSGIYDSDLINGYVSITVKWERAENRLEILADGLIHIRKEANIKDQPLDVTGAQVFANEEGIKQKILALTLGEARKIGIKHRSELKYLKEKVRERTLSFNAPVMRQILNIIILKNVNPKAI